MSAADEIYIEEMNSARELAYNQIEDAINDLFVLDVSESAILLSVRILYSELKEAKENEEKKK